MNADALIIDADGEIGRGGAKRPFPVGDSAYGMPRNARTVEEVSL